MYFYRVILIYYIVCALYVDIIKFKVGPVYFLDTLFAISLIYFFLNAKLLSKTNKFFKANLRSEVLLKYFLWFGLLFVLLSLIGYIKIFNIDNFELHYSELPRHCYFIFYSVIGISLFISLNKHFGGFVKDLKKIFLLAPFFLLAQIFGTSESRIGGVLIPFCIYYIYEKNKYLSIIYLTLFFLRFYGNNSTNVLSVLITIFFILDKGKIVYVFFMKYKSLFVGFILLVAVLMYSNKPRILEYDYNMYGRMLFWEDNYNTLIKTSFIGVGFGVPYFSNLNAFYITGQYDLATLPDDVLYVTGQHSSVVNMFYRLGIIGGMLFFMFNTFVFWECRRSLIILKNTKNTELRNLVNVCLLTFVLSFVNVAFHVGLESPRVFISYLIFASLIVTINHRVMYEHKRDLVQK